MTPYSDITPTSSHHQKVLTAKSGIGEGRRGRTTERHEAATPNDSDGRLGKHIRSTSAHSRTHTPKSRADSPGGFDSNHATVDSSNASTEKDAVFVNEGVDAFYDGQENATFYAHPAEIKKSRPPQPPQTGPAPTTRRLSPSKYTLNKLQRSSPRTLQRYSVGGVGSRSNEDEDGEHQQPSYQAPTAEFLSKPYDMTKTNSGVTSFTQKTEKMSNMTLNIDHDRNDALAAPTTLRARSEASSSTSFRVEMARKYLKHREQSAGGKLYSGPT